MSLRRLGQKCSLLSKYHQHNRHFVRFKKKQTPVVMEKYLDPEMHPSLSSKVTLVSQQESDHIFITKYSGLGFTLHNKAKLAGPNIFFPRTVLRWKVNSYSDINEKSLSLFAMLAPSLDLLIIGTGSKKRELSKETVKYLRKNKVNFEVLPSDQAVSAFNFQNNDQRWIAAAVIPPEGADRTLSKFVRNVYDDILDKTDLVYKDEMILPEIEGPDSDSKVKTLGNEESEVKTLGNEESKVKTLGNEESKVKTLGNEESKVKTLGNEESKVKTLGNEESKTETLRNQEASDRKEDESDQDIVEDKTEDLGTENEEKIIASPLGQSINYLSNDAFEVYKGPVVKNRD